MHIRNTVTGVVAVFVLYIYRMGNEMSGACGMYEGGERHVQGFGGETQEQMGG